MSFAPCTVWREIVIASGTLADYRALAPWHYRRGMPAVVTRVLVAWHVANSRPRRAGVIVEAMPVLNSHARDGVTANRYRAASQAVADRSAAARRVNAEIRVISRVVIHPTFRGIGLAIRLVRAVLATSPAFRTEAFAAMGAVNPFFEKAGMHAVRSGETVYYWWEGKMEAGFSNPAAAKPAACHELSKVGERTGGVGASVEGVGARRSILQSASLTCFKGTVHSFG